MNKKNKKLQLNKQIIANLNDIKGGENDDKYFFSGWFIECYLLGKVVDALISHAFDKGKCVSDGCSADACGSGNVSCTCFSAAKCA